MNEEEIFSETTTAIGEETRPSPENVQAWREPIPPTPAWVSSSHSLEEYGNYMRRHPRAFLIGALSLGTLIALGMRQRKPTFRERFIEEPMEHSRGLGGIGLLLGLGALARRLFRMRGGDQTAHQMAEHVGEAYIQPRPVREPRRRH